MENKEFNNFNNFNCKFCGIKIKTIKTLEKHLRRAHNSMSEREKNSQLREFLILFPQTKKKNTIISIHKKSKKILKEKKYFDKTESSINPIYTPMGNKR